MGATQKDALDNLSETLVAYLDSYSDEGAPFKKALRPIPRRDRVRLAASAFFTEAKELLRSGDSQKRKQNGSPGSVEHSQQDLTPRGFIAC